MIKFIFALLFVSSLTRAETIGMSMSAGPVSIGSHLGYAAQVASPIFFRRLAVQAQAGQMYVENFRKYSLFEIGAISQFYKLEKIQFTFKTMLEFFRADEISNRNSRGLHYAFGVEYSFREEISFMLEAGYSLAFDAHAHKIPGSPGFGSGPSFILGPKIFL
jgi:hypothetical protein